MTNNLTSITALKEIPITWLAAQLGYRLIKQGHLFSLAEHDSVKIYPESNTFCRFSSGVGGSPIDFMKELGGIGMTTNEAIKTLQQMVGLDQQKPLTSLDCVVRTEKQTPTPTPFELPQKATGSYKRTMAYLCKTRCLDPEIVTEVMKKSYEEKTSFLYQDERNNVCFVGVDNDGTPSFATKRSTATTSNFRGDVAGSNQHIGWLLRSPSKLLYVCEAPIDALSIATILKKKGLDFRRASYLATCGTQKIEKTLTYWLPHLPQIKKVIFLNDNDRAGTVANQNGIALIKKSFPQITTAVFSPRNNDINKDLCNLSQQPCGKEPKSENSILGRIQQNQKTEKADDDKISSAFVSVKTRKEENENVNSHKRSTPCL